MSVPQAVVAGIVPMLIYPLFLYWMDRFEKEPFGLIAAAFVWGLLPAALLSLISQLVIGMPFLLLDSSGALADAVIAFVVAPVTEEVFKGLALLMIFLIWRHEFDGVFDGIIYGGLVGFGFAAIENVLYFLEADVTLIVSRAVLFGLNHAFFTSLTGIGFGVARHARQRWVRYGAPLAGLAGAILMHAFHNTTLGFTAGTPAVICLTFAGNWAGIFFVFLTMLLAIRRERRWIADGLADEVALDTLSAGQYALAVSPINRFLARLDALARGGPRAYVDLGRYFHILTELAYKKHARGRRGDAGAPAELIEQLRSRAVAASQVFDWLG